MADNDVTVKIDRELMQLQDTLKDRLKETQDLSNLNKTVFKSSLQLEQHTAKLEKTANATKWKWIYEYAKWLIIAGAIVGILLLILFRLLFKK